MQAFPAAAAAGEVEHSVRPLPGIDAEPAGAINEGLLARVSGASLHRDIALHNDDVVLLIHLIHGTISNKVGQQFTALASMLRIVADQRTSFLLADHRRGDS